MIRMRATLCDQHRRPITFAGRPMINVAVRNVGTALLCRLEGPAYTQDRTTVKGLFKKLPVIMEWVVPYSMFAMIEWLDDEGQPLTDEAVFAASVGAVAV